MVPMFCWTFTPWLTRNCFSLARPRTSRFLKRFLSAKTFVRAVFLLKLRLVRRLFWHCRVWSCVFLLVLSEVRRFLSQRRVFSAVLALTFREVSTLLLHCRDCSFLFERRSSMTS